MKFDTVIFDFGDTLVTLKPSKEEIVYRFLSSKGIAIPSDYIQQGYRILDYCCKLSELKLTSPLEKREFLMRLNRELFKILGLYQNGELWAIELYEYLQQMKKWVLLPDVERSLRKICDLKFRMAIFANWNKDLANLVERMGIKDYFSEVVSSGEIGLEKPDPEAFLYCVRLMSVDSSGVFYVGNEYEVDVVGARKAGLMPVLIDRKEYWPTADCLRFRNLAEFSEYLQSELCARR